MRPGLVIGLAAAAAAVAALTGSLVAGTGPAADDKLTSVRAATSVYRNVDRAIDAGYVQFFGCVHEPLEGGMGIHFVNAELVGDPTIDPTRPEALMYEAGKDGRYTLAGAEYVVFKEAWDAGHDAPPSLFGETFHTVTTPNRYGIPAFYELHAWAWKTNPTGAHEDFNPAVLCPTTEGHTH